MNIINIKEMDLWVYHFFLPGKFQEPVCVRLDLGLRGLMINKTRFLASLNILVEKKRNDIDSQ